MSLVPLLFSDWWEDLERPHHLLDQDFGMGIAPNQLVSPKVEMYLAPRDRRSPASSLLYCRPWAELLRGERGSSTVQADKDKFQVTLDVQQFKPDEIDVKIVDKFVIVNAKHEEKKDEHGWIAREFSRKYLIPEQCDIEKVASKLSSDGVLTITAPRKEQPASKDERKIEIKLTGKPAIQPQKKPEEKKEEKKEAKK